jgi:hypothetical protein
LQLGVSALLFTGIQAAAEEISVQKHAPFTVTYSITLSQTGEKYLKLHFSQLCFTKKVILLYN